MSRILVAILFVAASLAAAVPLWSQTAHVTGTVKAKPKIAEGSGGSGSNPYGSRNMSYVAKFDYKHLHNVVIYAEPKGSASASTQGAGQTFVFTATRDGYRVKPDFMAMAAGNEIVFRNDSSNPVTAYARGDSGSYLESVPPKSSQSLKLTTIDLLVIGCVESSKAKSKLFVSGPYFAIADAAGKYSLDLPPGDYTLTAWHERLPSVSESVHIGVGENRTVDFVLSVNTLPEVPLQSK